MTEVPSRKVIEFFRAAGRRRRLQDWLDERPVEIMAVMLAIGVLLLMFAIAHAGRLL